MKLPLSTAVIGLLLSLPIQAYEIGDTVSNDIAQKLNLPEGKVSVIDFFASWCLSCEKEIPGMKKFIRQDTEKKAQIIGVDVDEELKDGLDFQKRLTIDFPVINDPDQQIIEAFAPIAMPALYYVIDKKIVGKRIGAIHQIDQQITNDLKGYGIEIK